MTDAEDSSYGGEGIAQVTLINQEKPVDEEEEPSASKLLMIALRFVWHA